MNYEKFQQLNTNDYIGALVENNIIDSICLDEIHNVKVRNVVDESLRHKNIKNLIARCRKKNKELKVIGMSGTPCPNNLQEVRSIIELITGKEYDDIGSSKTLANIHNAYKALVINGIRYVPSFPTKCKINTIEIDCTKDVDLINKLTGNENITLLDINQLLTKRKLEEIKKHVSEGSVVIYSQYVDGISDFLCDEIKKEGRSVGLYNGNVVEKERAENLSKFIKGELDVLICSNPITTGVNGLQKVCNKVIINALPFTDATLSQFICRFCRRGSNFDEVEFIIPQVIINTPTLGKWSYDIYLFDILNKKKCFATAVLDGDLKSYNINQNEVRDLCIKNLKNGFIDVNGQDRVNVTVSETIVEECVKRNNNYITNIHRQANTSKTSTIFNSMSNNNGEQWKKYHEYREVAKQEWAEDPVDVIAEMIKSECENNVVGDMGCGVAKLNTLIGEYNEVISVDFYSDKDFVIKADATNLKGYIDDGKLDIAVYCLSLWGTNWMDNLKEAYRMITNRRGELFICEPTSKFGSDEHYKSIEEFVKNVEGCGFKLFDQIISRNNFNYFRFIKVK